jgi:hypothetical protein
VRRILLALIAFVLVLAATAGGIVLTGNTIPVIAWFFKPNHGWDPSLKAPAPDYAQASSWAALPAKPNSTDFVPQGAPPAASDPKVDVFFVHPTGEMNGADWNSPLNANSQTEENTHWMMANQASSFNGCCAVYAPRYREGSILTYFSAPPDIFKKTMDLAYTDVDRAFTYFLDHYSNGRPFILASHSQGTFHGFRLVKERIDNTPLASRMVAAYLIGGGITDKDVDALKTVHACTSATDLHCIIHWATWGDGGSPRREGGKLLCVNPLTWTRDGGRAPASLHRGGVPVSGLFQIKMWGGDAPAGTAFTPLKAPVKAWTWAECRKGLLTVADQGEGPFSGLDMGGKNYHGLDYPLFHMDIRENSQARVEAYLAGHS